MSLMGSRNRQFNTTMRDTNQSTFFMGNSHPPIRLKVSGDMTHWTSEWFVPCDEDDEKKASKVVNHRSGEQAAITVMRTVVTPPFHLPAKTSFHRPVLQ
jgi:hypothetical protein